MSETARPLEEWREDDGNVLWWKFPIDEPPYVGSPLDLGKVVGIQIIGADEPFLQTNFMVGGWPGYHTHWTPLPPTPSAPPAPAVDDGTSGGKDER